MALLQDLPCAALGIESVERNGHHYHPGLSQLPGAMQTAALEHHPDLYHTGPDGWPTLKIQDGYLDANSINQAPLVSVLPPTLPTSRPHPIGNHRSALEAPLRQAYRLMHQRHGHQHRPGESPFEICVGAILTQNTSWKNVEHAIANLKAARILTARKMHALPVDDLAELIRPAGYYNMKARRLSNSSTCWSANSAPA